MKIDGTNCPQCATGVIPAQTLLTIDTVMPGKGEVVRSTQAHCTSCGWNGTLYTKNAKDYFTSQGECELYPLRSTPDGNQEQP